MKIQTEWLSLSISCLAFVVSALTAWLTFIRRGSLRMTQPTVVYFGPDGGAEKEARNKVYLRTLLYSTSRRGQMIESMHVNLQRAETRQNFSVWVYGEGDRSAGRVGTRPPSVPWPRLRGRWHAAAEGQPRR
jgi:hypothetical protein